ncbi:hypothetical protein IPdc08_01550 [archaeon]|nr:hypothetical protein IPdc08_01550 [archaeon]
MGISHIKAELALKGYIENKITLCTAAQTSGMFISEFASGKGIPFIRYPIEEAVKDLDKLRKLHASSP